jgi:hypothetical protein
MNVSKCVWEIKNYIVIINMQFNDNFSWDFFILVGYCFDCEQV